ncbi:MAG: amidohydrolase family protein [Gemmatimonadetes bacterium]|nr:amidohydrolase family protein [Gemmatimonadota bacterium]
MMTGDILIENGTVMDGTGKPGGPADVIIRGDRIEDVGHFPEASATRVIDARGMVVAPGFIDSHTHLDFFLPSPRHPEVMERWARQGVTTLVTGNCGFSPAPISPGSVETVRTYWNFALPRDGLSFEWSSMSEYMDCLARNGLAYNTAIFTGHNVLRLNAMGVGARASNRDEMAAMKTMLRDSLEAGSIGLSVGLMYCPGCFSRTEEIAELGSVLADFGAPLAAHTRGMSETYDEAVGEVIHVAERCHIPLQLSHHAGGARTGTMMNPTTLKMKLICLLGRAMGERFVIKSARQATPAYDRAQELIRQAAERGVMIGHDMMPWMCAYTTLLAMLPPRLYAGGMDRVLERLSDPETREEAIREKREAVPQWPPWDHGWWTDNWLDGSFYLSGFSLEQNLGYENVRLQDIAADRGTDLYHTAMDLIVEEEGRIFFVYTLDDQTISDWIGASLISDPECSIMTDIVGVDYPIPAPTSYGAFTKVLGQFARDEGRLTQEEAVRKMTSLPARQMNLKDRGVVRKGAFADITIFDPDTVGNCASFENPQQFSAGIEHVMINGTPVLQEGRYDAHSLPGAVVKRS